MRFLIVTYTRKLEFFSYVHCIKKNHFVIFLPPTDHESAVDWTYVTQQWEQTSKQYWQKIPVYSRQETKPLQPSILKFIEIPSCRVQDSPPAFFFFTLLYIFWATLQLLVGVCLDQQFIITLLCCAEFNLCLLTSQALRWPHCVFSLWFLLLFARQ